MRIAIDAGHGLSNRAPGVYDPGVVAAGVAEADLALLWALAGAGLGAWLGSALDGQFDHGLAGPLGDEAAGGQTLAAVARAAGSLVLAALAGAVGWRLARPVDTRLRWSGQGWEVRAPDGWQPAALQLMLDLGGWMLLRVRQPAGRARWIGASDAAIGPPGHLLRAALYCAPCVDPGRADEDRARS